MNLSPHNLLHALALLGKAERWEAFLNNPVAVAITIVVLALGGVAWYVSERQEARKAEAELSKERGRDSIWNQ